MSKNTSQTSRRTVHTPRLLALPLCGLASAALASVLLAACGGGEQATQTVSPQSLSQTRAEQATASTTLTVTNPTATPALDAASALPKFHLAPLVLDTPDDRDADGSGTSAFQAPHRQGVPEALSRLSTRRLTLDRILAAQATADTGSTVSNATTVVTYTPAQIRTAYGLPALPAAGATLTASQAAQLGAGQTIYIVDAMSDTNVAAELAAFNAKFGLPTCTQGSYNASTKLPLAAASTSGCQFFIAPATTSGGIANSAPPYDSGWATEIALDVQWSHATAPLARIVLIEVPDASLNSLAAGVQLANSMGPGIVSMSFGGPESNSTASAESVFSSSNMTYLAATGDNGEGVSWPAVTPSVLAVGGTTLSFSGSGTRSEIAWSGTGGGISAYTAAPSYQARGVPGITSTPTFRSVADVAFNADPSTGQYMAVIQSGSSSVNWMSVGGTSLATPQWAGLIAIADAMRAANSQSPIGMPQPILYTQISTVPGSYASAFDDIVEGSDGSCSTCSARTGYDEVTGLGTPNANSILSLLSGATIAPTAPTVTSATINGKVGTALSFTVSATAPDALTYSLSGAPSGMTIASNGVVTWSKPVAGTYSVVVTAKDTKTGLSGQGTYKVVVTAAGTPAPAPTPISVPIPAPVVIGGIVNGAAGTPLSFNVAAVSADPLSYSLSGAPSGMTVSSAGVVSWYKPVSGLYSVTVVAKDTKTGQSGEGLYAILIAGSTSGSTGSGGGSSGGTSGNGGSSGSGPSITVTSLNGTAGTPLMGTLTISDPGVSAINITINNLPLGVMPSANGLTIALNWPDPVAGTYTFTVQISDSAGHSLKESIPITIAPN